MVRLQKNFAYKYLARDGERVHYKYSVVLPNEAIEKLGWENGIEELEWKTEGKKLILLPIISVPAVKKAVPKVRPVRAVSRG